MGWAFPQEEINAKEGVPVSAVTEAKHLFRFSFRAFLTWSNAMDVPAACRDPDKKLFVMVCKIGRFFLISDEQTPVRNAT